MNPGISLISKMINKGVTDYKEIQKQFKKSPKVLEEQSKKNTFIRRRKTSIETNPQKLLDTISRQSTSSLNDWLLTIKEFNIFYEKTHIPPKYIFYAFSNYKKHKLNEEEEKKRKSNLKKIQNWLEYWIVFFLFYNLETFFGSFFQKIPMYLFYKVIFLAVLFLPWYKGAHYIYRSFLREVFRAYEGTLYNFFLWLIEIIKEKIFIDKPKEKKNLASDDDDDEPVDSTPDESEIDESN